MNFSILAWFFGFLMSSTIIAGHRTFAMNEERKLSSVEGQVREVNAVVSPAPGLGIQSEVTIEFLLSCTDKFETFSYLPSFTSDGKLQILASAVISRSTVISELSCSGQFLHEEIISVDGVFSLDEVTLSFLKSLVPTFQDSLIYAPDADLSITALDKVSVYGVTPLCPPKTMCITNGTSVTLATTLGCLDRLAGISYRTRIESSKLVIELFGAKIARSKDLSCEAETPFLFSVPAIMQFVNSVNDVELHLLR